MYPDDWRDTDYYRTLGVPRDATLQQIKSEYRWLAKKFHPDFNPADDRSASKFREIQIAYDTLSNKEKRALYDEFLGNDPTAGETGTNPPQHSRPQEENKSDEEAPERKGELAKFTLVSVFSIILILVSLVAFASLFSTPPTPTPAAVSTASDVTPRQQPPPIRWTSNDISACRNFEKWEFPTRARDSRKDRRALAMQFEVQVPSFFYLADDSQLIRIANAYGRAAGTLGIAIDSREDALANVAVANMADADGRLRAVCSQVR